MAFQQLPTFVDEPSYEYRTTLADREYVIQIDWNGREDRWYLALSDATGKPISGRRKIVCGKDLLRHCHHLEACPRGGIFAFDPKGTGPSPGEPPSFAELGRRVTLHYGEV